MHFLIFALSLLYALESFECQNTSNIGSQNIAVNKTTRQSSVYKEGVSGLAVDGDIQQILRPKNTDKCAHTSFYEDVFWWAVDLKEIFSITSVLVYGRVDACVERLSNFEVILYNPEESLATWDNYTRSKAFLMHTHGGVTLPAVIHINCPTICIGRYVRIELDSENAVRACSDDAKALTLCEVEVYGEIYQPTTTERPIVFDSSQDSSGPTTNTIGYQNVALHKPTRQSSTFNELDSGIAVNGNIQQILIRTRYCTHTDLYDDVFWWTVDLEETFSITNVVIYGRTDGCVERLSNFELVLYNPEDSMATWDNYTKSNAFLMHKHGPVTLPSIINISCSTVCIGRYVRIQIDNNDAVPALNEKALTLCEVEVYGDIYVPTTTDLLVSNSYNVSSQSDSRTAGNCQCPCKLKETSLKQHDLEVEDSMNEISNIIKSLKVNKTLLSKTRRSKISSHDERVSSQYIGICAVAILISIPCLVICSDLFNFLNKR